MQGIKSFKFQLHFHATRTHDHHLNKNMSKNLLRAATCTLQGNLVTKTACLQGLRGIFNSSLVSMLGSIGENFKPR